MPQNSSEKPGENETSKRTSVRERAAKCAKVGRCANAFVRLSDDAKCPESSAAEAARAAAFDAFTRLALAYFENPSVELRAACEAAPLVVRTMQKVG